MRSYTDQLKTNQTGLVQDASFEPELSAALKGWMLCSFLALVLPLHLQPVLSLLRRCVNTVEGGRSQLIGPVTLRLAENASDRSSS